ncbi:poly-beta-1,6-N-acetyl-D-glucosamine N-deacetylase PgaB [Variovorax sp. YR216]|uniref:poly-beta-1,6-N-acetyl-D-glucosamine N-deacetylase PgaB n=1 Tax=Variovorax sp. YR216 TaxID=1882828 RepID=UPI00089B011C|nr:poly-beta-1,6-N-acetyl-D-glucosamine N-deacetylase PgaB [Variovorax sp. YR216]SEB14885.1 poly-beta-1,6-N-acetyl-D-glucosamine N-deacetylase PgaB [Variovorax sp. YR216]
MIARSSPTIAFRVLARVLLLACLCVAASSAFAEQPAPQQRESAPTFVAFAFHDIVDAAKDLDDDGVTADRLVGFFDWLRGNGWTPVSLDDIARARRGEKPLPARAVLLTFDDGYRSLYTRVYPLALAYGYPIVAALVGDWLNTPPGAMVRYGDREVPREHFIDWEQAREMQRSGLVEFALHTQSLHREVLGNPQGNTMPAAVTRRYSQGDGYQSEAAFVQALRADLQTGRALLQRELGRVPRALVWPYGRYNAAGTQVARDLGFEFVLTLDVGATQLRDPLFIARYLPTYNPSLADLTRNLQPDPNNRRIDRLVCLDPGVLWRSDADASNEALGGAIERARALGVTALVVDAVRRDSQGRIVAAWFPTQELPLAGDWLSRIAWQMRTRAGVRVYVRLPHRAALAALGDEARVQRLYADLGGMVPLDGWLLEDADTPASPMRFADPPPLYEHRPGMSASWSAWVLRTRRQAMPTALAGAESGDALGWKAFALLDSARPGLELLWLAPAGTNTPHPLADISLAPVAFGDALAEERLASVDPRMTYWFTGAAPPDARALKRTALAYQSRGAVSMGWCPDDPVGDLPRAAIVAPGVSAAVFPLRR